MSDFQGFVEAVLDSYGYAFTANSEGTDYRFRVTTSSGAVWRSQILVSASKTVLRHFVYLTDDGYRADRQHLVGELVHLCNDKAPLGAFVFEPSSGAAFYRYGVDLRGVDPTDLFVERFLNASAFPVALWETAYRLLGSKSATPRRAFNAALVLVDAAADARITKGVRKLLLTVEEGGKRGSLFEEDSSPPCLSVM